MKKMILMLMAMVVFGNVLGAAVEHPVASKIVKLWSYSDAPPTSVADGDMLIKLENMPNGIEAFWVKGSLDENKALISQLMISYVNGLPVKIWYDNAAGWGGSSYPNCYLKIWSAINE